MGKWIKRIVTPMFLVLFILCNSTNLVFANSNSLAKTKEGKVEKKIGSDEKSGTYNKNTKPKIFKGKVYLTESDFNFVNTYASAGILIDSWSNTQRVTNNGVVQSTTYGNDYMDLKTTIRSNDYYWKDDYYTFEFWKKNNDGTMRYYSNVEFDSVLYKTMNFTVGLNKEEMNDEYLYIRLGVSEYRSDDYYSDSICYKVKNPFYEPKENNFGWQLINNKWYYYNEYGQVSTGWFQVNNTWYYANSSGEMQTGWLNLSGKWYYLNISGAMSKGWLNLSGKWYYFNGSGEMQKNWIQVGNTWYYMNTSGEMQTGWLNLSGKWYYLNSSGAMQIGWLNSSGKWYYFNGSGEMQKNWIHVGNIWYYMNTSGEMQTGWLNLAGTWYYFEPNGSMVTGWKLIDNTWYYFYESGAMK